MLVFFKVTQCQYKSAKNPKARITAIQWINGHDIGLVLTGADDGSVKLWRMPNAGSKDMILITAWQAFTDMGPPLFKSSMDVGFPGKIIDPFSEYSTLKTFPLMFRSCSRLGTIHSNRNIVR